tara:strand:+ start:983 stop:1159 length:177 start_codon:yes stop_codon:yes gene_type:complete
MVYKVKEIDGKYAVLDNNNEVAGFFAGKTLATKIAERMNKDMKPAKKAKKAKKEKKSK